MKMIKQHENVIKPIEYGNDVYENGSGKRRTAMYIVVELAMGGELMNYV